MTIAVGFDDETKAILKAKKASNKFLELLASHHSDLVPLQIPVFKPEVVQPPLPPIPNKAISNAHEFFPSREGFVLVESIMRAVLQFYPLVTLADLKSARKDRSVVLPRQLAMFIAKKVTLRSLPDLGRRFGGRDHTTVMHAVNKIARLIETDAELAHQVENISAMFQGAST